MQRLPLTSPLLVDPLLCESTIACIGEEVDMKRKHHSPEQIVRTLREADRLLGEGTPLVEVCKHLQVTEATYLPVAEPVRGHESR